MFRFGGFEVLPPNPLWHILCDIHWMSFKQAFVPGGLYIFCTLVALGGIRPAHGSEFEGCGQAPQAEATELAAIRTIASSLNPRPLEASELGAYMDAFSARGLERQLKDFPKDRTVRNIQEMMALGEHCTTGKYAPYLGADISVAKKEELLLKELDRPFYFISPDSELISAGDDFRDLVCIAKIADSQGKLSLDFIRRAIRLPHITMSTLSFVLSKVNPSREALDIYLYALSLPVVTPADVISVMNGLSRVTLSTEAYKSLMVAVMKSAAFREEPRALAANLLSFHQEDQNFTSEKVNLLSEVNPPLLSSNLLAGVALSKPVSGRDYSSLYHRLAKGLSFAERGELLDHFLYSDTEFSSGSSEVQSLLKSGELSAQHFLPLALQETSKPRYLDSASARQIIENALSHDKQSEGQLSAIVALPASHTELTSGELTYLLMQAAEKGKLSANVTLQAVVGAQYILARDASQEGLLVPFLFRITRAHKADEEISHQFESQLHRTNNRQLRLKLSAELIDDQEAEADLLLRVGVDALGDSKDPDFFLAMKLLGQKNLDAHALEQIAFTVQAKFTGKSKIDGLEPLLRAIETHPLATVETKRAMSSTRSTGWNAPLDASDIPWDRLMKK